MAKQRLVQPKGGKITVGTTEREWFAARRKELGLDQAQLGRKVGASQGTISNLENGKHTQITKTLYANLQRVCGGSQDTESSDEKYRELTRILATVGDEAIFSSLIAITKQLAPKAAGGAGSDTPAMDSNRGGSRKGSRRGRPTDG